jgi:HJR/Mrr/RecB family endonuclease
MAKRIKKRRHLRRYLLLVLVTLAALAVLAAPLQRFISAVGIFAVPLLAVVAALLVYGWVLYRKRRRLRVKAFNQLLALTPSQFELAVADLLHDLGYRSVKRVGRSGDLAADISCKDKKGRSVVVQCKRHAPGIRVGSRDVQAFIGMVKVHHQVDSGIFVTTSEFTAPASELARQHDIMLIDGGRLAELVEKSAGTQSNRLDGPVASASD